MSWLSRFRIGTRLILIGASFTLPLAVLVWLVVAGISADMDFARQEQRGNGYQRVLAELLAALPAQAPVPLGAAGPDAVDAALGRLVSAQARDGRALEFDEAGLARRGRAGLDPEHLAAEWASGAPDRARSMIPMVRGMMTHLGDTSNLILDPDLDSYYLMDVSLLALPAMQERLVAIHEHLDAAVADGVVDGDERLRLGVDAALLSSDRDRIASDVATAIEEDDAFHGLNPGLLSAVRPATDRWLLAVDAVLAELGTVGAGRGSYDRAIFERAWEVSFELWKAGSAELDALLDARLEDLALQRLTSLLGAGVALLLALVVMGAVATSIRNPVARVAASMRAIAGASGDLSARLPDFGADEVGDLARDFNSFVGRVEFTVEEIRADARRVNEAVVALAEMAARLDAVAEATAAKAVAVSQATSGVSANLQTVAAGSSEMSATASDIAANTHRAVGVVAEAVEAAERTGAAVNRLDRVSREIGEVVGTIRYIAEQTRLLSLNASIEAARAGEAGKGFAVVAGQVKELAGESARATQNIQIQVEAVAAEVQDAVRSISTIRTVVQEVNLAASGIASAVEEQGATTQSMDSGIHAAADRSGDIAAHMHELSEMTATTTSTVAELQRAGEALRATASDLDRVVGSFRTAA